MRVEERWIPFNKCALCGKTDDRLVNIDYCWPSFNFDFCEECAKDTKACDDLYWKHAKPYIKQHKEYWSKQENIDRHNAETEEWRKNNPHLLVEQPVRVGFKYISFMGYKSAKRYYEVIDMV